MVGPIRYDRKSALQDIRRMRKGESPDEEPPVICAVQRTTKGWRARGEYFGFRKRCPVRNSYQQVLNDAAFMQEEIRAMTVSR